jgi:hypothetical protein
MQRSKSWRYIHQISPSTRTQDEPALHMKIKRQNNGEDKWQANYSAQDMEF